MKVADRARYQELKAERKDLQQRILAIDTAVRRVDRFTGAACVGQTECEGCPMHNICKLADKAAAKASVLRKRLSEVHKELSVIFSVKEGM